MMNDLNDAELRARFFTNWPVNPPLLPATQRVILAWYEKTCREHPKLMIEESAWWEWRDPDALAAAVNSQRTA